MTSKDLLKIDYKLAAAPGKDSSDLTSPLEKLCYSTSTVPDARASALLISQNPGLKVGEIRAHLFRGNLSEAEEKIAQLENSDGDDEITRTEIALEKCRLAAFRWHWEECLSLCNQGLALSPPALTHLCLLQVRGLALYELGALSRALNDTEMVLSQEKLFPHAVPVLFSKIQRLKILLGLQGPDAILKPLGDMWTDFFFTNPKNWDQLLILLRLEIDVRRAQGRAHARLAHGALRVARALGDRLYEGLALLDLFAACEKPGPSVQPSLEAFENEFERIHLLRQDAARAEPLSSSGVLLRSATKEKFSADENSKIEKILFPDRNAFIDLATKEARKLEPGAPWLQAAEYLCDGVGIEKKDFFHRVWKQKYSPNLHDGVLRTFIYRLRKKHELNIVSKNGRLSLENISIIPAGY